MSSSAVHSYDFHIFTVSYSSLHGFVWDQHNEQLPVGLSAPVSLRSLVQFPYRPEYFQALFSPLLTWWS